MMRSVTLVCGLLLVPAAVAQEWTAKRMPWGAPDLQGTWTNATITTLYRPEEIDDLVITEAQAASTRTTISASASPTP